MLDFREVKDWQSFEDLVRELLDGLGLEPLPTGVGPDRGADFLVNEPSAGPIQGRKNRRWVVECKHFAKSGRAVGANDINDVPGCVSAHEASGYLLVSSTRVGATLRAKLSAYSEDPGYPFIADSWDSAELARHLAKFPKIADRYFPQTSTALSTSLTSPDAILDTCRAAARRLTVQFVGRKYLPELYVNRAAVASEIEDFLHNEHASRPQVVSRLRELTASAATLFNSVVASLGGSTIVTDNTIEADLSNLHSSHANPHRLAPDVGRATPDEPRDLLPQLEGLSREFSETVRKLDNMLRLIDESGISSVSNPPSEFFELPDSLNTVIARVVELGEKTPSPTTGANRGSQDLLSDWSRQWSSWSRFAPSLRPVFVVVDRAGGGKTNLLCFIAESVGSTTPCVLLTGDSITGSSPEAIRQCLLDRYHLDTAQPRRPLAPGTWTLPQSSTVAFVIDAINENSNPREFNNALQSLIQDLAFTDCKFIVSCRDVYWSFFQDDFWTRNASSIASGRLYTFGPEEYDQARRLYFRRYNIAGRITGGARKQLHHPLLLRFFCEAYAGTPDQPNSMSVSSIRLKKLFDDYFTRKLSEIRDRAGLPDIYEIEELLQLVCSMMRQKGMRSVLLPDLIAEHRTASPSSGGDSTVSLYTHLRDEDVIFQDDPKGVGLVRSVRFVYEEFLEYMLARSVLREIAIQGDGKISVEPLLAEVRNLAAESDEFPPSMGAIEYLIEFCVDSDQDLACELAVELAESHLDDVLCRALLKVSAAVVPPEVFDIVEECHRRSTDPETKRNAWQLLERGLSVSFDSVFAYVTSKGVQPSERPNIVFSLLSRGSCGLTAGTDRTRCALWICGRMSENGFPATGSMDHRSGLAAIASIVEPTNCLSPRERTRVWKAVRDKLDKIDKPKASHVRHLKTIHSSLKNRSKSYLEFWTWFLE